MLVTERDEIKQLFWMDGLQVSNSATQTGQKNQLVREEQKTNNFWKTIRNEPKEKISNY